MSDVNRYYLKLDEKFRNIQKSTLQNKTESLEEEIKLEDSVFSFFALLDSAYKSSFSKNNPSSFFKNNVYYAGKKLINLFAGKVIGFNFVPSIEISETPDSFYENILKAYTDNLDIDSNVDSFRNYTLSFFSKLVDSVSEKINAKKKAKIDSHLNLTNETLSLVIGKKFLDKIKGYKKNEGDESLIKQSWSDIVGNSESKIALKEIAKKLFLYDIPRHYNPYLEFGELPKSVLLYGPPGTGKTSIVKAMISQMQNYSRNLMKPFKYYIIDNTIKSKYYSESVKKLDAILKEASNKDQISLVVLEDIDLLFSSRDGSMHEEEGKFLNHFMNFVDGLHTQNVGNALYISTTNNFERIDSALESRISEQRFYVGGPRNIHEYASIIKLKLKKLIDKGLVDVADNEWNVIAIPFMNRKVSGRDTSNFIKSLYDDIVSVPSPEAFFGKSYDDQVNYLRSHTKTVTSDYILKKFNEYFSVLSNPKYGEPTYSNPNFIGLDNLS